MQVVFKNDWFDGERRWKKNMMSQTVPEKLENILPRSAQIVEFEIEGELFAEETTLSLKDFDTDRIESDSYSATMNEANETFADNFNMISPAAKELIGKHQLDANSIIGTGKEGRITKFDVEGLISKGQSKDSAESDI
jgi:pyruvate/2-oxoglutarate dehydrogenase complex dihydrolipoamide acyltransferase (E2) component|tara:strand:+ start:731 stop:1144 length:414 start_codon:yes stop_codon:yes gene_type:complete